MVGRLQTGRDKARVLEAMKSASGDVDVSAWDARMGQLGKREFVLKTARSSQPSLFTSRWAMSFLRGPLTRAELLRLREDGLTGSPAQAKPKATAASQAPTGRDASFSGDGGARPADPAPSDALAPDETPVAPSVASGIRVGYVDAGAPWAAALGIANGGRAYEAGLAFKVRMLFDEERSGLSLRHEEEWEAVLFPLDRDPRVEEAVVVDYDERDFRDAPGGEAPYVLPEAPVHDVNLFRGLAKELQAHLYRGRTLELLMNPALKLYSRVGEEEELFRARCLEAAEDEADKEVAKLRDRFERKLGTARDRRDRAALRVRELEVDVETRRQQEIVSGAGALLSMFRGGKARASKLSGISSRRSQTRRTQERLSTATAKVQGYEEEILELENELAAEVQAVWAEWEGKAQEIEPFEVTLEKNDIEVEEPVLFWAPVSR
jgi:hypothetical protein